jgi:hypothetical protein
MRGQPRILNWKEKLIKKIKIKIKTMKIIFEKIINHNYGSNDKIGNKLKYYKRTKNKN